MVVNSLILQRTGKQTKRIFYSLIEIHSIAELDNLGSLLGEMSDFLHKYYDKSRSTDSDSQ